MKLNLLEYALGDNLLDEILPGGRFARKKTNQVFNENAVTADSAFLPSEHYDKPAIAAFLKKELGLCGGREPRMPQIATGLFVVNGCKYVTVIGQKDGELLAVYCVQKDGSFVECEEIPEKIRFVYE